MSWSYAYTFLQTCAIEFPFYYWFFRSRLSLRQSLLAVLALNAFTHPVVFFLIMAVKASVLGNILVAEFFAFGFEIWACAYFLGLPWKRALAAGGLANLASWQLGSVFTYYFFLS
jgi:hypothetical protein